MVQAHHTRTLTVLKLSRDRTKLRPISKTVTPASTLNASLNRPRTLWKSGSGGAGAKGVGHHDGRRCTTTRRSSNMSPASSWSSSSCALTQCAQTWHQQNHMHLRKANMHVHTANMHVRKCNMYALRRNSMFPDITRMLR